jgi:predicted TIM-barrel fold metal-dependent hydrolase
VFSRAPANANRISAGMNDKPIAAQARMPEAVHPVHVARLARDLPELRIVLCHAGFPHWWQAAAEAITDYENCVLDVSNWNELLHEPAEVTARLATSRSLVGSDRILFASDQPSGQRFTGPRSRLASTASPEGDPT